MWTMYKLAGFITLSTENTKANHIFTNINTYPRLCLSEKKSLKDVGRLFSNFTLPVNPIRSFPALLRLWEMMSNDVKS